MTYGFIGTGNMASAIIKGMTLGNGGYSGNLIYVYNRSNTSPQLLHELCNVNICTTAEEVIKNSDVLILAVKPNVLTDILPTLKSSILSSKPIVISIAVGRTIEYLETTLDTCIPIVRVMPNINSKVACSTSAYCTNTSVTCGNKRIVEEVFGTIGSIVEIPESEFSIFGAIAGSSVAFVYLFMDALARAGQKAGMSKSKALQITADMVLGSAKMVLESSEHPWNLIDQVCSPGGTTIEGICTLEELGFETTIIKAFDAIIAKDMKLQGK